MFPSPYGEVVIIASSIKMLLKDAFKPKFPSPYGEVVIVTESIDFNKDKTKLFPSPYGEVVIVTFETKETITSEEASFRPLTGKWSLLRVSYTYHFKGQKEFPSPYGEVVIVTCLSFIYP